MHPSLAESGSYKEWLADITENPDMHQSKGRGHPEGEVAFSAVPQSQIKLSDSGADLADVRTWTSPCGCHYTTEKLRFEEQNEAWYVVSVYDRCLWGRQHAEELAVGIATLKEAKEVISEDLLEHHKASRSKKHGIVIPVLTATGYAALQGHALA